MLEKCLLGKVNTVTKAKPKGHMDVKVFVNSSNSQEVIKLEDVLCTLHPVSPSG